MRLCNCFFGSKSNNNHKKEEKNRPIQIDLNSTFGADDTPVATSALQTVNPLKGVNTTIILTQASNFNEPVAGEADGPEGKSSTQDPTSSKTPSPSTPSPSTPSPSTPSPSKSDIPIRDIPIRVKQLSPQEKNADFFRSMMLEAEAERTSKAEEEGRMDRESLKKLRASEAEAQMHEKEKLAHYQRLGKQTVVIPAGNQGKILGRGGRGSNLARPSQIGTQSVVRATDSPEATN